MMIMRANKASWSDIAKVFGSTAAGIRKQVLRWGKPLKSEVRATGGTRQKYPTQHLSAVGDPIPPQRDEAVLASAAAASSRQLLVATLRYGAKPQHYGHLSISPAQCKARLKAMGAAA